MLSVELVLGMLGTIAMVLGLVILIQDTRHLKRVQSELRKAETLMVQLDATLGTSVVNSMRARRKSQS